MRNNPVRGLNPLALALALAAFATSVPAGGGAQPPIAPPGTASPGPRVAVTAPGAIHVGDHVEVELTVLGLAAEVPVLVTPVHEGTTLAVVRGRLARADSSAAADGTLTFRIPAVALEAGTAVVAISVESYVCNKRCRRVVLRERLVLTVRPPR